MAIKQHIYFSNIVFRHSLFGIGAAMNRFGAGALEFGAIYFFATQHLKKIDPANRRLIFPQ